MKFLVMILLLLSVPSENPSVDFGTTSGGSDWRIVNDDVMGGRSTAQAQLTDTSLYFFGKVSLENNGGFASVRSPYQTMDLSSYSKVTLRVKGTARKFALSLDTSRAWFRANYKQEFEPHEDEWQELTFNLNDFKQSRIGRYTGKNLSSKKQGEVIRMGIILFDKKAGPFELEIDYIKFW